MTDFDAIRARHPGLTLNVYAPAGAPAVLEVLEGDEPLGTFQGATLAACLARAFPTVASPPEPEPPAEPKTPAHGGLFD